MRVETFCALVLSGALTSACLVADPRPTPGSLSMTASGDAALRDGFETSDGWTVSYERFLASLGHVSPEGDACVFYSDTAYNRVLDMRLPGAQPLSVIYALGTCELDFEVSSPWSDSVLGSGVSAADRDFMRMPGSDDHTSDSATSLQVQGIARKGGLEKRFEWLFRKRIDYANCYATRDGQLEYGATFRAEEPASRDLTVHGAAIFQSRQADDASTLFAAFADADDVYGDRDGSVTLSELGLVPLADISTPEHYTDADPTWVTLEDYVYSGQFTRIVRYQGDGGCAEMEVFPNDRVPR